MSALVFRKSVLEKVCPVPLTFRSGGCDSYFAITAALFSRVAAVDEALGIYRIHGANAFTDNFSIESLRVQLAVEKVLYERAAEVAESFGIKPPEEFKRIEFAEFPISRKIDLAREEGDFLKIAKLYSDYVRKYALPEYGPGLRFLMRALRMGLYGLLSPRIYKKLRLLANTAFFRKKRSGSIIGQSHARIDS
jgi:hypothetical protein